MTNLQKLILVLQKEAKLRTQRRHLQNSEKILADLNTPQENLEIQEQIKTITETLKKLSSQKYLLKQLLSADGIDWEFEIEKAGL